VAYTLPVIAQQRPRLDQLLRRPLAPHPPLPPATAKRETVLVTWGQLWEHRASRRWRQWASSGPAVRVPDLGTAKQRAGLGALRGAPPRQRRPARRHGRGRPVVSGAVDVPRPARRGDAVGAGSPGAGGLRLGARRTGVAGARGGAAATAPPARAPPRPP